MDDDRLIEAAVVDPEDREFDVALRPTSLAEFVGQERVKEQLQLLVDGARRMRGAAHVDQTVPARDRNAAATYSAGAPGCRSTRILCLCINRYSVTRDTFNSRAAGTTWNP